MSVQLRWQVCGHRSPHRRSGYSRRPRAVCAPIAFSQWKEYGAPSRLPPVDASITISFQDLPPMPRVEAAMRQRAAEIARRFPALLGIRFVVDSESNRFLTDHDYIVTATVESDDGTLVIGEHKRHPDLASAIECTFAALTARLERAAAHRVFITPPAEGDRPIL